MITFIVVFIFLPLLYESRFLDRPPISAAQDIFTLVCNISKRGVNLTANPSNGTAEGSSLNPDPHLSKRLLPSVSQGEILNYLETQSKKDVEKVCPYNAGGYIGPSYCYQTSFAAAQLTNNQFLAGTADTMLTGCTVLVVASARAVYICHFWEDLYYYPWGNRAVYGFQPILNMIRGEGDTIYAAGPALNKELFTGLKDHTWAFIMTPRQRTTPNDELSQQYPAEYRSLVELLKRLVPGIGITKYNYFAWPKNHPDTPPGWAGVALFEYDRNADGKGNPDWRVWMEQASFKASNLGLKVS